MPRVGATKFKSFIQQAECKSPKVTEDVVYPWTIEQIRSIGMEPIWLAECRVFLRTLNVNHLINCFPFRETPQGESYWIKTYLGERELTMKDISFVKALVDYYDGILPEDNSPSEPTPF